MDKHNETLYYHTFAPEVFVVTNADGVVVEPIEINIGRDDSYEWLLVMTTDDRGEPTPEDVQVRAIEQMRTYFVVTWEGRKVIYK